jgi:molybdopterin converting factor small subunit
MITVRLAEPFRDGVGEVLTIDQPVRDLGELVSILEKRVPSFAQSNNELFNFAVNGELVLHNEKAIGLKHGDEVELLIAFSGG